MKLNLHLIAILTIISIYFSLIKINLIFFIYIPLGLTILASVLLLIRKLYKELIFLPFVLGLIYIFDYTGNIIFRFSDIDKPVSFVLSFANNISLFLPSIVSLFIICVSINKLIDSKSI